MMVPANREVSRPPRNSTDPGWTLFSSANSCGRKFCDADFINALLQEKIGYRTTAGAHTIMIPERLFARQIPPIKEELSSLSGMDESANQHQCHRATWQINTIPRGSSLYRVLFRKRPFEHISTQSQEKSFFFFEGN